MGSGEGARAWRQEVGSQGGGGQRAHCALQAEDSELYIVLSPKIDSLLIIWKNRDEMSLLTKELTGRRLRDVVRHKGHTEAQVRRVAEKGGRGCCGEGPCPGI